VGVSALRVPEADVERFLERLYLLPQLPELDLPEGLGRAERMLDPVPHLDVYSPGSAQAAELLTGPGRNSLVARVSFDYAGQRISPARRGRFVPAAVRPVEDAETPDTKPPVIDDNTPDTDGRRAAAGSPQPPRRA